MQPRPTQDFFLSRPTQSCAPQAEQTSGTPVVEKDLSAQAFKQQPEASRDSFFGQTDGQTLRSTQGLFAPKPCIENEDIRLNIQQKARRANPTLVPHLDE